MAADQCIVRRFGLGIALALVGCANPAADAALTAQSALIGMPKQTLLSCAGVPARSTSVDNLDYYTYSTERVVSSPGPYYPGPFVGPPWYGGWRYGGWGSPFDYPYTEINTYSCAATFTLKNGVVQQLVYGGADPEGAALSQCYAIVRNCLALVPPPQIRPPGPAVPKPPPAATPPTPR
jgi:hypothetical protein